MSRLALAQRLVLAPIELYRRFLSPLKPVPSCRFHPTCSSYAVQAVREHGALIGLSLAIRRVLRCHPWNPGGFDPVPPRHAPHGPPPGPPHGHAPHHLARHQHHHRGADRASGAATEES